MKEKEILTEKDLKKIKDNFNSGMDRMDNLMTDFNDHMDRMDNLIVDFMTDFNDHMDRMDNLIADFMTDFMADFNDCMNRLASSIDNLKANMDSLEKSLDEANRWASLAQEAAEIEAVRVRLAANAPKKRFILRESVARGVRNPFKDPSVEEGDIEGPIV